MKLWGAWLDPVYQKAIIGIFFYLLIFGLALFPLRRKNLNFRTAWLIYLSWLFAAPIVCLILGLAAPIPLVFIGIIALLAMREFFQMTGVYNDKLFIWPTYIATVLSISSIHYGLYWIYNLLPMILFGLLFQIPLLKNEFKQMIQKTSLCLVAFLFIGWAFLHMGFIAKWEHGARYIIYIILLTEFYDTIILSWSKLYGKINFIEKIAPRRSLEGLIIGFVCTMLLARGIRNILPVDHHYYWIASGIIACLIGGLGDISMGVIRRDLGVKDVGAYVFGRGGIIDRIDRLIFVAPIYYYTIMLLRDYYLLK